MAMTHGHAGPDERNVVAAVTHAYSTASHRPALALTVAAVVLSSFHFWPFEQSKLWQMVSPPNLVALIWIALMAGSALRRRKLDSPARLLPHVSILAFLALCILSLAFARDMERALSYSVKSCLMLFGGYALFRAAMTDSRSVRIVLGAATLACIVSTSTCFLGRYGFQLDRFGFFDNGYKYGTYTSVLSVLCGTYLLASEDWKRAAGAVLILMAGLSCATLGGLAGLAGGTAAFMLTRPGRQTQGWIAAALILGTTTVMASPPRVEQVLRRDLSLAERETPDLRQRYIEWQAQINLLGERTIPGTGAGSVNDYRSKYYNRLPKLNTLEAFDQNGWLACGAEMGVWGLVCFTWAVISYFRIAARHLTRSSAAPTGSRRRLAAAGLAGLVAAGAAHLFSSVHYNGVLIVFALVLALISRVETVLEASSHASG